MTAAYLLHRFAYSDSDLILKFFTQEHGLISCIAKQAKRSKNPIAPTLQPFCALAIEWHGKQELKKLKQVESLSALLSFETIPLYSAFYLNELLMYLLPKEEPHPLLFSHYENALISLSQSLPVEPTLRRFEWALLEALGIAPNLTRDTAGNSLEPHAHYELIVEHLPRRVDIPSEHGTYSGQDLIDINHQNFERSETLKSVKRLMRHWISFYCQGRPFKSREILNSLQPPEIKKNLILTSEN